MDNVRLLLFMALAFIGMLIYQAWQQDYGPGNQIAAPQPVQPSTVYGEMPDAPQRADIDSAMPDLPGEATSSAAATARLIGESAIRFYSQPAHQARLAAAQA